MLRFPNPGSTVDNFVAVYRAAFDRLNGLTVGLDDMVRAVVASNLATSSGYMGEAAVVRSTRKDRSRDPLYNQLKMYAELFRALGWLHPTPESSLLYNFTLLGKELDAAGNHFWPLLEECLLGIEYPNRVIDNLGSFELRPFAFLVKTMAALDGHLSRDEMIVGPLSYSTDRNDDALSNVVDRILAVRESKVASEAALHALAVTRRVQVNTLRNYTRWPIAMLRDCGWTIPSSSWTRDGKRYDVWALTEKGKAIALRASSALDLRMSDVEALPDDSRRSLIVTAHYGMLGRSGFDVSPFRQRIETAKRNVETLTGDLSVDSGRLMFSPFQALRSTVTAEVLGDEPTDQGIPFAIATALAANPGRDDRSHLYTRVKFVDVGRHQVEEALSLHELLSKFIWDHGSVEEAAKSFVRTRESDTKRTFYPLVRDLFQVLGYRSELSRAGVNYQRWDACVWEGEGALPVEIKSPTEELRLSTKSVRQALENKVILLARGGLPTSQELASLIVGYQLPQERGEMSNLLDNVYSAFQLQIGVIDLLGLTQAAMRCISKGVFLEPGSLGSLRGYFSV